MTYKLILEIANIAKHVLYTSESIADIDDALDSVLCEEPDFDRAIRFAELSQYKPDCTHPKVAREAIKVLKPHYTRVTPTPKDIDDEKFTDSLPIGAVSYYVVDENDAEVLLPVDM